jgi:oxygen-independent coproporphyrinogen-3 oxidase
MHLYIHIPFCEQKCHYCAFNSFVASKNLHEPYIQALLEQLKKLFNKYNPQYLSTIFFGGGTPSCVDAKLYKPIFEFLWPYIDSHSEISSEANPNSASSSWLQQMHDFGLNRISLGVQSFHDEKLKLLGRNHKGVQAKRAISKAQDVGFENISIDLIYGTSLDTKELLFDDIAQARAFGLKHLSAYTLTLEENTPLYTKPEVSKDSAELANFVRQSLYESNLPQYEVSNYGTLTCKHNLGYWKYEPYIGAGCGAVGFDGQKRYKASSNLKEYLKNPNALHVEIVNEDEKLLERLFLGLRANVGVDKNLLSPSMQKRAQILIDEKMLDLLDNRFYAKDLFLADEIVLFLLEKD